MRGVSGAWAALQLVHPKQPFSPDLFREDSEACFKKGIDHNGQVPDVDSPSSIVFAAT